MSAANDLGYALHKSFLMAKLIQQHRSMRNVAGVDNLRQGIKFTDAIVHSLNGTPSIQPPITILKSGATAGALTWVRVEIAEAVNTAKPHPSPPV